MCNTCWAEYHRRYRDTKRRGELKSYVEELATDPSDPRSFGAKTRTEAVVRAMLTRFGGLERFADDWFQFLKLATMAGKHHVVQRSFEAMLRLLEVVDRSQPDPCHQFDNMSREELGEFMTREFVHRIWREPDIGIVPLEALGFKVEPPEELPPVESLSAVCDAVRQRLPGLFAPAEPRSATVKRLAAREVEEQEP